MEKCPAEENALTIYKRSVKGMRGYLEVSLHLSHDVLAASSKPSRKDSSGVNMARRSSRKKEESIQRSYLPTTFFINCISWAQAVACTLTYPEYSCAFPLSTPPLSRCARAGTSLCPHYCTCKHTAPPFQHLWRRTMPARKGSRVDGVGCWEGSVTVEDGK